MQELVQLTWLRKAPAKNSSKLNKFLHSEVNLLTQPINTTYYSAKSIWTKQQQQQQCLFHSF